MTDTVTDTVTDAMTKQAPLPAYKKHVGYQGFLLGAFTTLAAALLVIGNLSTSETIELRLAEDLQASLSQVLPASLHDNNLLDNSLSIQNGNQDVIVYQGIKNGQTTAVAYGVSGQGYGGEIKLIMGIKANGEILGVRVLSHAETPGLGDRIEAEKDDWIYRFDGLSLQNLAADKWHVKKDGGDFDQFSGATITPRAVVKAVKQGLDLFNAHRDEMLAHKVLTPTPTTAADAAPELAPKKTGKDQETP